MFYHISSWFLQFTFLGVYMQILSEGCSIFKILQDTFWLAHLHAFTLLLFLSYFIGYLLSRVSILRLWFNLQSSTCLGLAADYICDLVSVSTPAHCLCSASGLTLLQPHCRHNTMGGRGFRTVRRNYGMQYLLPIGMPFLRIFLRFSRLTFFRFMIITANLCICNILLFMSLYCCVVPL